MMMSGSSSLLRSRVVRPLGSFLVCSALTWTTAILKASANDLLTYFSEQVPPEIPKPQTLSSEDRVVVAKVRVLSRPAYLIGPDQSGQRTTRVPRERWSAWLQVSAVIRGKRPEEERISVTFGGHPNSARGPSTPGQLAREYFVAMYEDDSGYHLIGVPISAASYTEWQREITESTLERARSPLK